LGGEALYALRDLLEVRSEAAEAAALATGLEIDPMNAERALIVAAIDVELVRRGLPIPQTDTRAEIVYQ
jgi:hypothetical protein